MVSAELGSNFVCGPEARKAAREIDLRRRLVQYEIGEDYVIGFGNKADNNPKHTVDVYRQRCLEILFQLKEETEVIENSL